MPPMFQELAVIDIIAVHVTLHRLLICVGQALDDWTRMMKEIESAQP